MKKLLAALSMSLLLATQSFAVFEFFDLSASHQNYTAIMYLREEGIISGYDDNTYRPDVTVNRAELLKILVEGQGITPDENTYKECFYDVHSDWFAKYVCYAKEEGWVKGYEDGNFRPADKVKKVEAAKMLVHGLGLADELTEDVDVNTLPYDDLQADQWYLTYLDVLVSRGIPEVTEGDYDPAGEMSRAKIAEYLFRVLVTTNDEPEDTCSSEEGCGSDEPAVFNDDSRDEFLEESGQEELVPSDQVEITAVNYRGTGSAEPDEYVEITNFSSGTVDLDGYKISGDNAKQDYFFDGVTLGAGESIKVYTNQGEYSFESDEPVWNNGNDNVFLIDTNAKIVDVFVYAIPSI